MSRLQVTVVWSPGPREVSECTLELEKPATVIDAVRASGLVDPALVDNAGPLALGVWGRKAALSQELRNLDRVEIYRTLKVDPKVARRERFRRQGARSTGLFARQRPGGKPGY